MPSFMLRDYLSLRFFNVDSGSWTHAFAGYESISYQLEETRLVVERFNITLRWLECYENLRETLDMYCNLLI